jgi:outer membrane protein assembly factor BamA
MRIILLGWTLGLLCLTSAFSGSAQSANAENARIERIRLNGLDRTQAYVVERELLVQPGAPFSAWALAESLQRIKNLLIFTDVRATLTYPSLETVQITIELTEKWTTLPIMGFGGGGGQEFIRLGLYDVNLFGRFLELGGRIDLAGEQTAGELWFFEPRLLGQKLKLGINPGIEQRVYLQRDAVGSILSEDRLRRYRLTSSLEWSVSERLLLGAVHRVAYDELAQDAAVSNTSVSTLWQLPGLRLRLGRLDYEEEQVAGVLGEWAWDHGFPTSTQAEPFDQLLGKAQVFFALPGFWNLGSMLQCGWNNSESPQFQTYLGGLEQVRGFPQDIVAGNTFWQWNSELRWSGIRSDWLVVQSVLFLDAGKTALDWNALWQSAGQPIASAGCGVRLISPRIYRLSVRLDYALALNRPFRGISFGVQQFF